MTEIFLKTKITLKNIYLIPFTQVLTGLRHSHIHTCVCAKWITKKTVFCFPIPIPLHQIIYEFIAQNLLPKVENREISLVKISILCNHCVIFILNRIKLRQANIALYIDTIASSIYSCIHTYLFINSVKYCSAASELFFHSITNSINWNANCISHESKF